MRVQVHKPKPRMYTRVSVCFRECAVFARLFSRIVSANNVWRNSTHSGCGTCIYKKPHTAHARTDLKRSHAAEKVYKTDTHQRQKTRARARGGGILVNAPPPPRFGACGYFVSSSFACAFLKLETRPARARVLAFNANR